jgi:transposase-like protein
MKTHTQWQQHVEAWRESGLSQADYCRQHGLNHKTFSVWTRRVQHDLSLNKDVSLELISVQVASSAPVAATEASAIILRLTNDTQLELSSAVSPRWLAELLQCLS